MSITALPLIAARGLTFGYDPATPVLRGVDLELNRGERMALTGANGAGKSTLLHLMVGLRRPQAGCMEAWGRPCRGEHDFQALRRRVALLFQNADDQLFCPTVLDDVAFGPLNLGWGIAKARTAAMQALDELGLTAYAARMPHHLSAGEKKMVALAAILVMRPEVLLLDEPTAGLDAKACERVAELLPTLPAALLVVSQDNAFLRHISRSVVRLENGRIVRA